MSLLHMTVVRMGYHLRNNSWKRSDPARAIVRQFEKYSEYHCHLIQLGQFYHEMFNSLSPEAQGTQNLTGKRSMDIINIFRWGILNENPKNHRILKQFIIILLGIYMVNVSFTGVDFFLCNIVGGSCATSFSKMVKLTEDMVIARSKGAELHNIKKLNCWGSELTNVAVVRNLPNVEVLSLSVNQISTLEDFQYCRNLQELYIRKNNINDINEVLYLQNIPKLKWLWLADNPCAEFDEYRLTVLRALPHLHKLDNIDVKPEEVHQAKISGLALPLPNSNIRGQEGSEIPRSNSNADSLKSESGGRNSSLSDSSPTSLRANQGTVRHSNGFNQSLEEGYEYAQNVYDEDEEQPQIQRTSMASPPHEAETYERKPHTTTQQLQNLTLSNGYFKGRNSRYYEPSGTTYMEYEEDKGSSLNNGQQQHPHQQYVTTARRQMYGGNVRSQQQRQGSPRRSSQVVTSPIDPESHGEGRSFSRSSADFAYDSHNANYVGREEAYPQSRRTSREQQYRDHGWVGEPDGYNRERGSHIRVDDGHRQSYVGNRPLPQDYRSPPSGEMRHFPVRPSTMTDVIQQHYDGIYRRVDQQIENASRTPSIDRPSPTRPYPLRPKTRVSNVLSAVLCLIKELDYSSLEVVEMAIRCRMDELED
ncbi:Protein C21orf2-like protein [Armadillidium nasatum]|uniref:Protein C21orf2-like protein n=1 Tax=Armadillidium nasatum TaxID=96803 RepID=A0A5N5SXY2_9CRUS|nr:Protein C21orf2-like protein [Armadillidium nasatum]